MPSTSAVSRLPAAFLSALALCAGAPPAIATGEEPVAASSSSLVPPTVTHHVIAKFPVSGRDYDREEQGMRMIMSVEVDADGKPGRVRVVDTNLGSAYRRPALQAVSHWRFAPATRDGVPEATTILVPVTFGYGDNTTGDGTVDPSIRAPGSHVPRVIIAPRTN
jgi:TonB family protein